MSSDHIGVQTRILRVGFAGMALLGVCSASLAQPTGTIKSSFQSRLGGVAPGQPRPFATRSIMDAKRDQAQTPQVIPGVRVTGVVGRRGGYRVADPYCDTGRGSGFRLDGDYSDDNLRVRVHIGSDLNHHQRKCDYPYYWRTTTGVYYTGYGYSRYDWPYSYRPPIQGLPPTQQVTVPATQPQDQPEPATAIDVARWSLTVGAYEDAVAAYREHLGENPDDALAVRELGLVLMETKKVTEGVAVIALAYDMDSTLAGKALEEGMFADGATDLRHAVTRAVTFANRTKSGASWLTVAMLMQGQGRDGRAMEMVERAEQVGLNPDIVEAMKRELQL